MSTANISLTRSYLNDESLLNPEAESEGLATLLHAAAVNGNKSMLQKLLHEVDGIYADEINKGDQFGRTPLVYSVLGDRLDCAELLIKYGASVCMSDVDGRTPLHWAAYQGIHKCVKLLLSKGADWKAKDTKGRTPLHFAASHHPAKCLAVLLKKAPKGEVDDPDNDSMTALHWGASYGNTEHVKMLLKARASVRLLDCEQKTPLHWGATDQNPGVVKLVIEQTDEIINWQDIEGRTALHLAVAKQNEAVVKTLLLVEKCDVSIQDNMYRTPLHWAAVLGNSRIVKLLLRRNADCSLADGNGATALHYAAQGDFTETVEVFLALGTVKEIADNEGRTPLLWAARKGASLALETMLHHNVDVHATDNSGRTALHIAAYSGDIKCVDILIQYGASVNALDELNHTPLFRACEMGYIEVVVALKQSKAMLDLEDQDGRTPLHWAALNGHAHICVILMKDGAQANKVDRLGCTALHCAAYGGFVNCMSVLIDNGADVNNLDEEGISALHWSCSSGHLEAVKLLLRSRAFPNFMKSDGERMTPLDYAILGDHQDVAQYMIEQGGLTITAIEDVAAATIQSCWRGYCVRKPFQKRKDLYVRHEQLRFMKKRAIAVKEEEDRERMNLLTGSAVHELSEEEGLDLHSSSRRAVCHDGPGRDGGFFELGFSLSSGPRINRDQMGDNESVVGCGQRFSFDELQDENPHHDDSLLQLSKNFESSHSSAETESLKASQRECLGGAKTPLGSEPADASDKCQSTDAEENLEEKNYNPENCVDQSKENVHEISEMTSHNPVDDCVDNPDVENHSSGVVSVTNLNPIKRNAVTKTVEITHPMYSSMENVIDLKRELVIYQTKLEHARKDRERRNLIRAKMEAATVIQKWYRRQRRLRQNRADDEALSAKSLQEQLVKQVAALTIQLAWRKYLRKGYDDTNVHSRPSQSANSQDLVPGKHSKSRNNVSEGKRLPTNAASRRSRLSSRPNTGHHSVRHRKTTLTTAAMSYNLALGMYSPSVAKRGDSCTSTSRRGRSNKIRPSTSSLRRATSSWTQD